MAQQFDEFAREHPTQEYHKAHRLRHIAPHFSAGEVEVEK